LDAAAALGEGKELYEANKEDWVVNKNEFQVLSYKSTDGAEYFPAFVFSHSTNSKNPMSLQEIETIYSQSRNFMS